MELSSDQKLDRIAARLKLLALTDDEYTYYLKKDEWSEREAIMVLSVGSEKVWRWQSLIESGRKSGKLKPTRYERNYYRRYDRDPYPILEYIYYYDPLVIVPWAILKEEPLPDKLIGHGQQLKLKQTAATQLESEQTNQPGTDAPAQSEEGIVGGMEAETLEDAGAPALKPRNKQRDNDALILLHAALDKLEAQNGKTPSPSELVAFILSGDFKHRHIGVLGTTERKI
jgi:hypothetical protein